MVISDVVPRECSDDRPECRKPVSEVLKTAVPAAILGTILLVGAVVIFLLIRRNKRQLKSEGAKARESLEIEIDDYPQIQKPEAVKKHEASYGVPIYGGGSPAAGSANGIPSIHSKVQEDRDGGLASKPVDPKWLV